MKKFKYMIKRILSMHFGKMFKTARKIAKQNHTLTLLVLIDIIKCGLKYMAGYVDYDVFDFYHLNESQRETMMTRGINNQIVATLNDKDSAKILDNKLLFNNRFNSFLKRDWLDLSKASFEDFKNFLKNKSQIIVKPIDLACGTNIEKINISDISDVKLTYDNLIKNGQLLIEDYIIQHEEMSKLYPESVNTLRIVTITKNNKVNIMFRSIRMGNSGNVVDNFNHGGLFTTISEEGTILKPAVDKAGNIYDNHPYSNCPIVGFKIPYFKEAIEYVKQMAISIPEVGYVGWDISITPNGPVVVEANPFPGHDIYQSKIHMNEDGTGMRKIFEKVAFGKD